MRERRPAPPEHAGDRTERREQQVQRPEDALQLASQMGNVAFTAYAQSVARQPTEHIEFEPEVITAGGGGQAPTEHIEFEPDVITAGGGGQPDEVIEFEPEVITAGGGGESGEVIEFPPDYITPSN